MPYTNNISIMGHAGSDADLKYSEKGLAIASVNVAVTNWRNKETTWFRVSAFGSKAEYLSQYVKKGDLVAAQGSVWLREYDKRDGSGKGYSLELEAHDVQAVGSRGEQERSAPADSDSIPF